MKTVARLTGAAAVLSGMLVFSGCQSSQVMGNRGYVPAPTTDDTPAAAAPAAAAPAPVAPAPAAAAPTAAAPAPLAPAPVAPAPAPAPVSFPRFSETETYAAPAKSAVKGSGTYVVKKGDTISGIAYRHGVRTSDLLAVNHLTMDQAKKIYIGKKLVIPAGGKVVKSTAKTVAKPTAKTGAKATGRTAAKNASAKGAVKTGTAAVTAAAGSVYVVKKGDSIPKIAKKLHVKSADLMAANNLDDAATRRLKIGQKLVIPGKGAAAAAAPAVKEKVSAAAEAAPAAAAPAEAAAAPAEAAVPAAAAAPAEAAVPAAAAAPAAAPAEAAPATEDKVDDSALAATQMDQITAETSVRDYLKAKNLTLTEFKKLNANTFSSFRRNGDDDLDAVIPAGTAVFIPQTGTPAAQ